MFLESLARPLLLVHLLAAAILVGTSTHQVLWSRRYLRDEYTRLKNEQRFVWLTTLAFAITFVLGNCLYPTYKVRVRAEVFDRAGALPHLASVARVFDIKEHAVALGFAASVALLVLSHRAHPAKHQESRTLYLGLAWFVCVTAWIGALVGAWTASYRSVGSI